MKIFNYLLLSYLLLSACSNQSSHFAQQMPEGNVPLMTLKQSSLTSLSDHLTGTLTIYSSPDNKEIDSKKISITQNSNNETVVSTKPVELERSTPYRFVLIFYWDNVAIAYVDTTQATENDDSTTITYSESMIVYNTSESSADVSLIAADISSGILPSLDLDNDGYSNLIEIRAGTDPKKDSSVPTGPAITDFNADLSEDGNLLSLTATITDGLGVNTATLSFVGADYLGQVTTVTLLGNNGDKQRQFSAQLNPQYAPVGELKIILTATDSLNLSSTSDVKVTITDNGTNLGPIINLESVSAGDSLGGIVSLSLRAYDKNGVDHVEITQPEQLHNNSSAHDRFIADWDTTNVSDGGYTIKATATDFLGVSSATSFKVFISNGSDATGPGIHFSIYQADKTSHEFNYQNSDDVYGNIKIHASASDPAGVDFMTLFNSDDFSAALGTPTTATDTTYINTINTLLLKDGEWTFNFLTGDKLGHESNRTFSVTVANHPLIDSFTVDGSSTKTIVSGTSVTLAWTVEHADVVTLTNNTDTLALVGSSTITPTASGTYTLTATRTTNKGDFQITKNIVINLDDDGDGVNNEGDNCVHIPNTDQANHDTDSLGDECDDDADNDGIFNVDEVTKGTNPINADTDGDGAGDNVDVFPTNSTETVDADGDGVGDNSDNCLLISNANQANLDGDALGDACDNDKDGDGFNSIPTGGTDCDDAKSSVYLGGVEVLDGLNNDCDGTTDVFSLSLSSAVFEGEFGLGIIGRSVSSGDFNGDGYLDLLISTNDIKGGAYLIYGKDPLRQPLASTIDLSAADVKFIGEYQDDEAGQSVSMAGDVNGDGYDDILIGAPYGTDQKYTGVVYLIYGRGNNNKLPNKVSLEDADVKFIGQHQEWAGIVVSDGGDINGDGYNDIAIGSSGSYPNPVGILYLIYGRENVFSDEVNLSTADVKFIQESDGFFTSLSTSGDVNGDGYDDILIGSPYFSTGGVSYLFYGKSNLSSVINASNADVKFIGGISDMISGISISLEGDINHDGYDDVLIGASNDPAGGSYAGAVYLVYGKDKNNPLAGVINLSNADVKFIGEKIGGEAGWTVASVGDVNGDDYDDILIGAPNNRYAFTGIDNEGAGYLIYGKSSLLGTINLSNADVKFVGENSNDHVGIVSKIGDINGDGYNDVLIGIGEYNNPNTEYNAGTLYLIYGKNHNSPLLGVQNLSSADVKFVGKANIYAYVGYAVSSAGDVNGDGYDDFLIAAPSAKIGASRNGMVYLIYGKKQNPSFSGEIDLSNADVKFIGEANSSVGESISSGDFNGDGYSDILIGAPWRPGSTAAVYLIYGRDKANPLSGTIDLATSADVKFFGNQTSGFEGVSFSNKTDLNNDGYDDIVIGALNALAGGNVYVIYGKSGLSNVINLTDADAKFVGAVPWSLSCDGDVNGDGYNDILIGDYNSIYFDENDDYFQGAVYLIYGKDKDHLFSGIIDIEIAADAHFIGETVISQAGYSVSDVGDVNGDGYDDILIGDTQIFNISIAPGGGYLVYGKEQKFSGIISLATADAKFVGDNQDACAGASVSNAGDVNGDGYDDILIGEDGGVYGNYPDMNSGNAYLFYGHSKDNPLSGVKDLSTADAKFIGEVSEDRVGASLSIVGDVNADGYDDLLIGAWGNDRSGTDNGATYLILSHFGQ